MKLGKNIKAYREQFSMSQESLAEKIFVTRQTVSNWENDKSYPDVHSIILLAETFHTSIDNLIKGDIQMMKDIVKNDDVKRWNLLSMILSVLFFIMILTAVPLIVLVPKVGSVIWCMIASVTLYVAYVVEKEKKKFDIQTYREILAFTEGKHLDEISKARESGKYVYQKILAAFLSALFAFMVAYLSLIALQHWNMIP